MPQRMRNVSDCWSSHDRLSCSTIVGYMHATANVVMLFVIRRIPFLFELCLAMHRKYEPHHCCKRVYRGAAALRLQHTWRSGTLRSTAVRLTPSMTGADMMHDPSRPRTTSQPHLHHTAHCTATGGRAAQHSRGHEARCRRAPRYRLRRTVTRALGPLHLVIAAHLAIAGRNRSSKETSWSVSSRRCGGRKGCLVTCFGPPSSCVSRIKFVRQCHTHAIGDCRDSSSNVPASVLPSDILHETRCEGGPCSA